MLLQAFDYWEDEGKLNFHWPSVLIIIKTRAAYKPSANVLSRGSTYNCREEHVVGVVDTTVAWAISRGEILTHSCNKLVPHIKMHFDIVPSS